MRQHRFFEIMPGVLSWSTLLAIILLSWAFPVFMSIFIIFFDIYWFFKILYLSIHLRISYHRMNANMKVDWLEKLKTDPKTVSTWKQIHHVLIFPFYKEPYEVIKETLDALVKGAYPLDKLIVVLAAEDRAGESAQDVAKRLEQEFSRHFFAFLITTHPQNLPGEIPGKGSNETWAIKQVKQTVIDPLGITYKDILVSVFDCDTQIFPHYFGILTYTFLTTKDNLHASYLPIPFFLNNIFQAPALARVISFSSSVYHMMQQARPHRLTTFSSHSMPFTALVEVGFYKTNIVSEDSQIFWQCYLHYNGNYRTVPLNYPVSMDANVAPTFWRTMINQYKQQQRWAWGGIENIPFMLIGFIKNKKIPFKNRLAWGFFYVEGFHSWATNALIIFTLSWLPIAIGGPDFRFSLISYSLPKVTNMIMNFSAIGIVTSAFLGIVLLPPKPLWFKKYHYVLYVLQWAFLPISMIIFGSIPALDAQTRGILGGKYRIGFWATPKHREKTT